MFCTYVLKEKDRTHFYVGSTNDLKQRINEHKAGKCISTKGRRWTLYCYFAFSNQQLARAFEKYLKSGSGRAFSKKHFEFKVDEA